MRVVVSVAIFALASAAATEVSVSQPAGGPIADWPYYGGDAGGSRYSRLTEINKSNVAKLKIAWEYHTGDVSDGAGNRRKSAFEATPIVADGANVSEHAVQSRCRTRSGDRTRKVELRSQDQPPDAVLGRTDQSRRHAVDRFRQGRRRCLS